MTNSFTESSTSTDGTPLLASCQHIPKDDEDRNANKKTSLLPVMVCMVILFSVGVIAYAYSVQIITKDQIQSLAVAPILQTIWAVLVVHLGKRGAFSTETFLHSMPIFWFPMITVFLQMSIFGSRIETVFEILDSLPIQAFVALQAIRSLAVGSLLKWRKGIFPTVFAWGTAFPDMLFGLSAMALLIQNQWIHNLTILFWWNLVGFGIIIPSGATMLQLGMKPTQLYESTASNNLIFEYPMVLAPGLVVPMLVSWNAIMVWWSWSRTTLIKV